MIQNMMYNNDHPLRKKMVGRILANIRKVEEVIPTNMDMEYLASFQYRDLVRPLIIIDLRNGIKPGKIAAQYEIARSTVYWVKDQFMSKEPTETEYD